MYKKFTNSVLNESQKEVWVGRHGRTEGGCGGHGKSKCPGGLPTGTGTLRFPRVSADARCTPMQPQPVLSSAITPLSQVLVQMQYKSCYIAFFLKPNSIFTHEDLYVKINKTGEQCGKFSCFSQTAVHMSSLRPIWQTLIRIKSCKNFVL